MGERRHGWVGNNALFVKTFFFKGVGLKGRKCGLDLSFFWNFFLFFCLILPNPQIQNKNPNNQKSPDWLFTTHIFRRFGVIWEARGSLKITVLCILPFPSLSGLLSFKNMQFLSQLCSSLCWPGLFSLSLVCVCVKFKPQFIHVLHPLIPGLFIHRVVLEGRALQRQLGVQILGEEARGRNTT